MIFPGITLFRTGQEAIIKTIQQGLDVIAVLPTGGGKSLCYQYPSYRDSSLVIVISPLIALMRDQVANLLQKGLRAGALYSGQDLAEKKLIFRQMDQGGQYILYLSPERVQKPGFKQWIEGRSIGLFAIDEAHCVSMWGHDFRKEYAGLSELKKWRPDVPLLALTASATPIVIQDIALQLGLKKITKLVYGFYRPNLYYQVEVCENDQEKHEYLRSALKQFVEGRVIIYCGTRKRTEELYEEFNKQFSGCAYYHAGLSSEQRNKVQEQYRKGDVRILMATNAFGMGIDQPDVRLVVHYQMPATIDALYQEMGRAGRDDKESTCLLLYSKKDKGLQSFFITSSDADSAIKSMRWDNLDALVQYAESFECRQAEILTYYQDHQRIEACGHCDVCLPVTSRRVMKGLKTKLIKSSPAPRSQAILDLDLSEQKIFEKMKLWRKQLAKEKDLPAFTILSDKTLIEVVKQQPQNYEDLVKIYGLGPAKCQQYGQQILSFFE